MLDSFHPSQFVLKSLSTLAALIVTVLLFRALRAMIRLGRKPGDRTFSDLPALRHGPQELPDQSTRSSEIRLRSPERD